MALRFGLGILTAQTPPGGPVTVRDEYRATLTIAEAAEALGFDSVWVSEHHFATDAYLPSVLPMLAAIAVRTNRVELGAAALLAPFHHPLRLAEDAAVVDILSGGRLTLALANGWRTSELDAFGIAPRDRASKVQESIEILRQAWSEGAVRHVGRHYTIDAVDVRPKPDHAIPLMLGGFEQPAVERAGRLADGFVASSASPEAVATRFHIATDAAIGAGRHELFRLAVMLDIALEDPKGAVEGYRYKQEVYRRWRRGEGPPRLPLPPGLPDDLLIRGDVDSVVRGVTRYVELVPNGDLTVIVRLHFPGMKTTDSVEALQDFAEQVIPRLKVGT